jgi:ABC-2 type transport system ATP-binding protein
VLRHLVRGLAAKGKAVLYSSHVMDSVEKLCSRVLVLHKGRVVADDSVERLRGLRAGGSLEDVFSELVMQEDPEQVAQAIIGVLADHA